MRGTNSNSIEEFIWYLSEKVRRCELKGDYVGSDIENTESK